MSNAPLPGLPFPMQRLVFFALIMGCLVFAVIVAVVQQQNGGKGLSEPPLPMLDTVAIVVGALTTFTALLLRGLLARRITDQQGAARQMLRFQATLVPLAVLEGGCLFALTVWMLNGNAVPALVVALVLLSTAIAILPFSDPDEGAGRT